MATRGRAARDPRRIYCEQYDLYWAFTLEGFLKFCREGMKDGHHDLNHFGRMLKGRPKGIYKRRESRYSFTGDSDVFLAHPLDWGYGDYQQAAIDIMEWWNSHGRKQ